MARNFPLALSAPPAFHLHQREILATANGALVGFEKAAAIEMPRGLRINVVRPGLLEVSTSRYGHLFPGHKPVSSNDVGLAYAKCVDGAQAGQVVIVG